MKPHLILSIRLIAFCFLVYGTFAFLREAISFPISYAHSRIFGPPEHPRDPFGFRDAIMMLWLGSPALVGAVFLWFSIPIARLVLPTEEKPAGSLSIACIRLILLVTLGFIACNFSDQCFNYLEMLYRYRHESTGLGGDLAFTAFGSLLPLLPVALFWYSSAWIGRRIASDDNTRNG